MIKNITQYLKNAYPVFLWGALFGKIVNKTETVHAIDLFLAAKAAHDKDIREIIP